ncbi:MAG: 3-methyladenine DNA glycosylase [Sulfurospirillaceae bacterium]|nr:3-methyladenine DNA glycosylase [Sulfurospirillaceae bacterium]
MNSFELLEALQKNNALKTLRDPLWWPRSCSFWVIVGVILTQQTKWEKVELSLENLEKASIDSLEKLAFSDEFFLATLINPSGFYNTKAHRLKTLCKAIVEEFGNFEDFCLRVDRDWLLAQKGIGEESADSILCYACGREVMVVDAYTARLLFAFGYEFDDYASIQSWLVEGILHNYHKFEKASLNEIYALFHGEIVEFCKKNSKGKVVNVDVLGF